MTVLRALTSDEIDVIASRPRVRRIAVENFLSSICGFRSEDAIHNLRMDATLYGWNGPMAQAIAHGIQLACKPVR